MAHSLLDHRLSAVTAARYALVIVCWGLLTTVAAWALPQRTESTPKPLEVLTIAPAHAQSTLPDPLLDVGARVERQETTDNIRTLEAAAFLEAARKATTTTTTTRPVVTTPRPRAAPAPRVMPAVVPSGPVPEGCMTGTRKTRAESDRCWGPLVAAYPWPHSTMLDIIWCESHGDESAVNSIGATGLLQLYNGTGYAWPGGTDPVENIRVGYKVKYVGQGLSAWSASGYCW